MAGELTGRISGVPAEVWNEEILAPQFAYEAEHLLGHYAAIERVLLLEYRRMGLVDAAGAAAIAERLDSLDAAAVRADPRENMSDISFAIERHVAAGSAPPFTAWHVDRSRNDLQSCAQLMAAREQVAAIARELLALARAAGELAREYTDVPMPGYTHAQAAQIITPGFYFAAVAGETLGCVRRLLAVYDEIDASPLGAGTMAGQELPWDRDRMAKLLGFARPQAHALVSVASRGWALAVAMELSTFAVTLSRFGTDLMTWGGGGYGFLELPDELSGISAAMPQKRNFPVLERLRGRCAHVTGLAFDLANGQRNSAFANTVEVSKEAGAQLQGQFEAMRSVLRIALVVVRNLSFHAERMREACEAEFLGGFTLANRLTLDEAVPWRTAQVIAGRYIKRAIEAGSTPAEPDGALLEAVAAEAGHPVRDGRALLAATLGVAEGLRAKRSAGSTHPDAVRAMLADQDAEAAELGKGWARRGRAGHDAATEVNALLYDVEP